MSVYLRVAITRQSDLAQCLWGRNRPNRIITPVRSCKTSFEAGSSIVRKPHLYNNGVVHHILQQYLNNGPERSEVRYSWYKPDAGAF